MVAELRCVIPLGLGPVSAIACAVALVACGGGGDDEGRDGGRRDAGRRPDPGASTEGHSCDPGPTARGSCMDPTNQCVTWSVRGSTTLVATCVRPCRNNADCANSPVGHVCANVALDDKACVSAAVATEGRRVDLSVLNGHMMEGCADPLQAIPKVTPSTILIGLEYDQASCALRCNSASDCSAVSPFCSLGVFTSTGTRGGRGICQVRRAGKGAKCSVVAANEMCDATSNKNMLCIDLGFNDSDNDASMEKKYGVCTETCDRQQLGCPARADEMHVASCKFGYFMDQTLGLCSDDCSSFPDNCLGPGSPPPLGGTGQGANCLQVRRGTGTIEMPELNLCVDVEQQRSLYAPYNFMMPPAVSCDKNEISCPHGTSCIGLSDLSMTSACIYGCNRMGTPNGCPAMFPACAADFGPMTRAGVCKPR